MRSKLRNAIGFAVAGMTISLCACRGSGESGADTAKKEQAQEIVIRYVKVVRQPFAETLDLPAKVQADPTKLFRIFPPASGRVVAIAVKPGDHVHRGQVVALLSSSDVASAQSDFAKANIEADRASRAMERQKVLLEHGATAEKDYLDARAQAEEARAELARAKQRLDLLNVSPSAGTDQVRLLAPAPGVVTDVSAAPGEFSKSLESASPLITIADLSRVWIVGDVYEKDVSKVARGTPVVITLQAYPERQWTGHIDSISGTLDPATRTMKVRVVVPNSGQQLKPEMFGAIHIKSGTHQALIVPSAAIIRDGGNTTVFVKNGGRPEQRIVTTGQTVNDQVEILTGLGIGEEVAADGAELLKGAPSE